LREYRGIREFTAVMGSNMAVIPRDGTGNSGNTAGVELAVTVLPRNWGRSLRFVSWKAPSPRYYRGITAVVLARTAVDRVEVRTVLYYMALIPEA